MSIYTINKKKGFAIGAFLASMVLFVLAFTIFGCNFVQVKVEVKEAAILDQGDGTADTYSRKGDNEMEQEVNQLDIKPIP